MKKHITKKSRGVAALEYTLVASLILTALLISGNYVSDELRELLTKVGEALNNFERFRF